MIYDLIIVGTGVAGLSASIYASRYKLNHLLVGQVPGGQGMLASNVENYPGFASIKGSDLMQKMIDQAQSYDLKILNKQIDRLAKTEAYFEVGAEGEKFQAKTLILAMGAAYRRLGLEGEEKLIGRGVSYCSTCDAPFFKDKTVAVIGGGDSAITGAMHLSSFASKVYIIHRREVFRAEPAWIERAKQKSNIEYIMSTQVTKIQGVEKVTGITLDKPFNGQTNLVLDGVFVEIGQVPASSLAAEIGIKTDEQGYIETNPSMETNVKGVFSAGDLSIVPGEVPLRQFITSAADGARAAAGVYQLLYKEGPVPSWGGQK
jgi:thioredoxin reductase (NADPH)